jgi:hypothetical protein
MNGPAREDTAETSDVRSTKVPLGPRSLSPRRYGRRERANWPGMRRSGAEEACGPYSEAEIETNVRNFATAVEARLNEILWSGGGTEDVRSGSKRCSTKNNTMPLQTGRAVNGEDAQWRRWSQGNGI